MQRTAIDSLSRLLALGCQRLQRLTQLLRVARKRLGRALGCGALRGLALLLVPGLGDCGRLVVLAPHARQRLLMLCVELCACEDVSGCRLRRLRHLLQAVVIALGGGELVLLRIAAARPSASA